MTCMWASFKGWPKVMVLKGMWCMDGCSFWLRRAESLNNVNLFKINGKGILDERGQQLALWTRNKKCGQIVDARTRMQAEWKKDDAGGQVGPDRPWLISARTKGLTSTLKTHRQPAQIQSEMTWREIHLVIPVSKSSTTLKKVRILKEMVLHYFTLVSLLRILCNASQVGDGV